MCRVKGFITKWRVRLDKRPAKFRQNQVDAAGIQRLLKLRDKKKQLDDLRKTE